MGFIYKITNKVTKKMYIGETKLDDPQKRWKAHLSAIRRGKGCPALRDAIQKHGVENFKFEVILICFDEDRFHYEEEYIKKYNTMAPNGYNILKGGIGGSGFLGKTHSKETREKLAKLMHERNMKPEMRKKLSEGAKGFMAKMKEKGVNWAKHMASCPKFLQAIKEKRVGAAAWKQKGIPDEIREKIRKSVSKYYQNLPEGKKSETNIEKHRKSMAKAVGVKVHQYTLEGTLVATFDSIADAARSVGVQSNGIRQCMIGKTSKSAGFVWKRAT
jgi:group I intron endonuclease